VVVSPEVNLSLNSVFVLPQYLLHFQTGNTIVVNISVADVGVLLEPSVIVKSKASLLKRFNPVEDAISIGR